jgi:diadenosine tetraphosphatase ApaH/serine/threonine PP2A family protein phosphatase
VRRVRLEVLLTHFQREGRLRSRQVRRLLRRVTAVLDAEPALLELREPLTIAGDVAGQFHDLPALFRAGGEWATTPYLFLGGYTGPRGLFNCETLLFLLALKAERPDAVWLLRGSAETRAAARRSGVRAEIVARYGATVYALLMDTLDRLPLAATVATAGHRLLCVHGGLSPLLPRLADIRAIERRAEPAEAARDLIWADPAPDLARDPILRPARALDARERTLRANAHRRGERILSLRQVGRRAYQQLSSALVHDVRMAMRKGTVTFFNFFLKIFFFDYATNFFFF